MPASAAPPIASTTTIVIRQPGGRRRTVGRARRSPDGGLAEHAAELGGELALLGVVRGGRGPARVAGGLLSRVFGPLGLRVLGRGGGVQPRDLDGLGRLPCRLFAPGALLPRGIGLRGAPAEALEGVLTDLPPERVVLRHTDDQSGPAVPRQPGVTRSLPLLHGRRRVRGVHPSARRLVMTFRRNPLAIALTGLASPPRPRTLVPSPRLSGVPSRTGRRTPRSTGRPWRGRGGGAALRRSPRSVGAAGGGFSERRAHQLDLVVGQRPRVEEEAAVLDPPDDRRIVGAEAGGELPRGRRGSRPRGRGARAAAARRRRPWRSTRRPRRGRRRAVARGRGASRRPRSTSAVRGSRSAAWVAVRRSVASSAARESLSRRARGRAGAAWRPGPRRACRPSRRPAGRRAACRRRSRRARRRP